MKQLLIGTLLYSVLISCSTKVDIEQLKSSILKNNELFMESITNKNAGAVADLYTEDCQFMAPNMQTVSGKEGVKSYMEHGLSQGITSIKLNSIELNGASDFAVERGTYQVFVNDSIQVDVGKYIVEWKKVGEKWLLHRDIMNSDLPAARTVAKPGESVWIVTYYVKENKGNDFESFVKNDLMPALDVSDPAQAMAKAQTRLLSPRQADKNGNLKYVFIMDPVVTGVNYDIENVLIKKHGEQIGKEKFKHLNELLSKGFEFTSVVQTDI